MNQNTIEQFIREHRDALDTHLPDAHIWQGVEKTLQRWPDSDQAERFILSNRILFDTETPASGIWSNITRELDAQKTDSLETFIQQNRESFDMEVPPAFAWDTLPATTAQTGRVIRMSWTRQLARAAAALALLISGVGIGMWYAQSQAAAPGMAMSELSSEYAELEQYYQTDIEHKKQRLATFASYHDATVLDDLDQMDRAMAELRTELEHVSPANREKVVRAMIENYQSKAAILQRVLKHIEEQTKDSKNSSNDDTERI
jgi:hypothetical protein